METMGLVDAFGSLDRRAIEERCARCHLDDLRVRGEHGPHAAIRSHSCTGCHVIHQGAPAAERAVPAAKGPLVAQACTMCHEEAIEAHLRSDHAALIVGPGAGGCEACHGPPEAHLKNPEAKGAIKKPTRQEQEVLCQSCHQVHPSLGRWKASAHAGHEIGCLACHDLLGDKRRPLRRQEMTRCGGCHPAEAAEFRLPNHHPVPEGAMSCSSCHDPHGGRAASLYRRHEDERCLECHPAMAGPFVFEHEADRTEGCAACHRPHGSPNRRLLTVWPVRNLCLQCHAVTPLNHDISSFSPFLECARCHTEVHGSDIDRFLFR
jgi:DmsE family decaheme c-type cytochrome